MELLNEETLAKLLVDCYENEEYHAAIMFESLGEVQEFLSDMLELYAGEGIDGVSSIVTGRGRRAIIFENGSRISPITASMTDVRGMRFHAALLDDKVMDAEAMLYLQSLIREYSSSSKKRKKKTSNEEIVVDKGSDDALTDFLTSFKIANENTDKEVI